MRNDPDAVHSFATLRFAGDELNPRDITDILRVEPNVSYRKGEAYPVGPGRERVGKTNIWMVTTEGIQERSLQAHLRAISKLIAPTSPDPDERVAALRRLVETGHVSAVVTVFWHGRQTATPPVVPRAFEELIGKIRGKIETDFLNGSGDERTRKSLSPV